MRIFKNIWFARFAEREGIPDSELKEIANRLETGKADADLGGGVYKVRSARSGEGKSGGYRVIVFYRSKFRIFFVYGFAKSDRDNIDKGELQVFKNRSKDFFSLTGEQISERLTNLAAVFFKERKMKKRNVHTVLAVTLLVTAVLLTNCISPVEGRLTSGDIIPAGKGVLFVSPVDNSRGTIIPGDDQFYNLLYDVIISDTVTTEIVNDTIKKASYDALTTTPIYLAPGNYTYSVFAFSAPSGDVLVLKGSKLVTITSGQILNTTVSLVGVTDGVNNGTFNYTINFPSTLLSPETVNIKVANYYSEDPTGLDQNYTSTETASFSLPSGYYLITTTTTAVDYRSSIVQGVLHIYPTLTSYFTYNVPQLGKENGKIIVRYDANGGSFGPPIDNVIWTSPMFYNLAVLLDTSDPNQVPPDPTSTLTFMGWYKDAGGNNAWSFTADRIWGDTTLYAKWEN